MTQEQCSDTRAATETEEKHLPEGVRIAKAQTSSSTRVIVDAVARAEVQALLPRGTLDLIDTLSDDEDDGDGESGSRDESCLRARAGAALGSRTQGDNDPRSAAADPLDACDDGIDGRREAGRDDRRRRRWQQQQESRRCRRLRSKCISG